MYLAFGAAIGLFVIRWTDPSIFDDPPSAIAVAVFLSSVLGSILFYVKPDRLVTRGLRWWTFHRYREEMESFAAALHIAIETWRMNPPSAWENPEQSTRSALNRLTKGPDLHDDIVALKGCFYLFVSLPIILYAVGLDIAGAFGWSLLAWTVLAASLWVNFNGFIFRCSRVSLFRLIQQTYSVFRARDPDDRPTQNWFIGDSTSRSEPPIEPVLEELETMLKGHDMEGFMTRFQYIENEFDQWLLKTKPEVSTFYVRQWASVHSGHTEYVRDVDLKRTLYLKRVLQLLVSKELVDPTANGLSELVSPKDEILSEPLVLFKTVDVAGMDARYEDALRSAFYKHIQGPISPEVVNVVLGWYERGFKLFEDLIVGSAEHVEEKLRKSIVTTLLKHSGPEIWRRIGPIAARTLSAMKAALPEEVVVSALRSGNEQVILELLPFFDIGRTMIAQEFAALVKTESAATREAIVTVFWDEKPERVVIFLSRSINDKEKAVRTRSARLILELSRMESKTEEDSGKLDRYRKELKSLLLGRPVDVQIAVLEESIESGIPVPLDETDVLLRLTRKGGAIRELALKVQALGLLS